MRRENEKILAITNTNIESELQRKRKLECNNLVDVKSTINDIEKSLNWIVREKEDGIYFVYLGQKACSTNNLLYGNY